MCKERNNKPQKIVYKNQGEIHDLIRKFLKSSFKRVKCKAYLVGSSTTGKFGIYEKPFKGEAGSDIDIVVFIEIIPLKWKKLDVKKSWWNLYRVGELQINNNIHFVNAMVVKKGKEVVAIKKFKELGWIVEKVK
jgi:predicted nucleotidyltransferase